MASFGMRTGLLFKATGHLLLKDKIYFPIGRAGKQQNHFTALHRDVLFYLTIALGISFFNKFL